MDYSMTVPCNDCPFRRVGGIRLHADRVKEIGGMMLSGGGGTFPCHKTTKHDYEGNHVPTDRRCIAPAR